MVRKILKPPIKYPGGKTPIAKEIKALMKGIEHTRYLEAFFGGGSVLLAKDPEGIVEIANDIYQHNYEFWATLRDKDMFSEFVRLCHATPFCETTWKKALEMLSSNWGNQIERAHAFFISSRLSRQGSNCFATPSKRPRRGQNEFTSAYWSAVDRLPELHERLAKVLFLCRDAVQVIESQDDSDRLIYADPPYIESTRVSKKMYAHEMDDEDHENLVDVLLESKSKVLLSGYPGSERIYSRLEENGWGVWERSVAKHSSSRNTKPRTFELIWANCELNTVSAQKWIRRKATKVQFSDIHLHSENLQMSSSALKEPLPIPRPDRMKGSSESISGANEFAVEVEACPLPGLPPAPSKSSEPWFKLKPLLKLTSFTQE